MIFTESNYSDVFTFTITPSLEPSFRPQRLTIVGGNMNEHTMADTRAVADKDVSRLAVSLENNETELLKHLFSQAASSTPTLLWSPSEREIHNPVLKKIAAICWEMADEDGFVRQSGISEERFGPLFNNMMVVTPTENPSRFRYSHYGSEISKTYGYDMTGKTTDAFEGHISLFFASAYRAAGQRREWLLSEHEPPSQVFARNWRRLVIPMKDDAGQPSGFVVGNVPDNELRAGLEIVPDPILVVDAGGIVRYANQAACEFWDARSAPDYEKPFEELTGISFAPKLSPSEMLGNRTVVDKVDLAIRNSIVERFLLTINAAVHRDTAFYIVMVRMMPEPH